ncbi:hypothetical protein ACVGV8_19980, partial [Enterobacter intestinihominis]
FLFNRGPALNTRVFFVREGNFFFSDWVAGGHLGYKDAIVHFPACVCVVSGASDIYVPMG